MTTATNNGNQLSRTGQGSLMQMQVGRTGLMLNSFQDMWSLAQCVHRAGMAPKSMTKPEQVLVALQWGAELGVGPMQALSGIAVINGRPAIWGDLGLAMVRRSGKCESVREWVEGEGENMVAYCEAKRKPDGEICKRSFSYVDAKVAGLLSKDTYRNYLRRMLQMRARSFCLRDLFADLLVGLGIAEEVQDHAFIESGVTELESGDDAPLNSLDDAAALLEADEPKPHEMTKEEIADALREQAEERHGGKLFETADPFSEIPF
jgi:hypothetical protein